MTGVLVGSCHVFWSQVGAGAPPRGYAEALVYTFGARGVEMAQTFAGDPSVSEARHAHFQRVARIAERRQKAIQGLDLATQYHEMARWQRRPGNLIGGGHPAM